MSEISPGNLRGRIAGVIPQLHITLGILFGQILGFNEILGIYWHISINIIIKILIQYLFEKEMKNLGIIY